MFNIRVLKYSLSICAMLLVSSMAQAQDVSSGKMSDLSFSDLANMVTSVSKRPEQAFTAPAAIFVITQEDIRNSGLRSIPEILRMAPGLQVTQVDAKSWAITSRGFNDGFGNKLLVLMDGRSVYTPLFSGVYWDAQDTFIDDIDRIEIIRGPGATLWGANAVNGVINIITKNSKETQNNVISTGIGKEKKAFLEARHGNNYKNKLFYRVYGKRFDNDASKTLAGDDARNEWNSARGGFRIDLAQSDNNDFTFQGDIYNNHEELSLSLPNSTYRSDMFHVSGGNFLTKWNHKHVNDSTSSLQMYVDHASADYSLLQQNIDTYDIDYQYNISLNNKNNVIAGIGYRFITDDLGNSDFISYTPTSRGRSLFSGFVQDTYTIVPDKLNLTFGSKVEHNDFTGVEVQPNIRLAWLPDHKQTVWASVSRAVRTPNRSEDDLSLVVAPGYVRWLGNRQMESEKLIAYEVGYRIKPKNNWLFDTAIFYNDYDDLRTNEVGAYTPPDSVVGLPFDNKAKGEAYGVEVSSEWNVTNYWTLKAGYTFLTMDVHLKDGSTDSLGESAEGASPKNQFNIGTVTYFPHDIQLSANMYYVDNVSAYNVPSYIRMDTRIAWEPRPGVELSLVGFNMLDDSHQEFGGPLHGTANEIERGYYAKASIKF